MSMDKVAKRKYNEIVKYLKDNGKFNKVDTALIEVFANAYSTYKKYYEITLEEGAVLTSDKGNKYLNPANMVMQQSFNTMRSLAKELGIGNFSRAKLDMQIQEKDEFKEFLEDDKK